MFTFHSKISVQLMANSPCGVLQQTLAYGISYTGKWQTKNNSTQCFRTSFWLDLDDLFFSGINQKYISVFVTVFLESNKFSSLFFG